MFCTEPACTCILSHFDIMLRVFKEKLTPWKFRRRLVHIKETTENLECNIQNVSHEVHCYSKCAHFILRYWLNQGFLLLFLMFPPLTSIWVAGYPHGRWHPALDLFIRDVGVVTPGWFSWRIWSGPQCKLKRYCTNYPSLNKNLQSITEIY